MAERPEWMRDLKPGDKLRMRNGEVVEFVGNGFVARDDQTDTRFPIRIAVVSWLEHGNQQFNAVPLYEGCEDYAWDGADINRPSKCPGQRFVIHAELPVPVAAVQVQGTVEAKQ